jgi:hypothetical protein
LACPARQESNLYAAAARVSSHCAAVVQPFRLTNLWPHGPILPDSARFCQVLPNGCAPGTVRPGRFSRNFRLGRLLGTTGVSPVGFFGTTGVSPVGFCVLVPWREPCESHVSFVAIDLSNRIGALTGATVLRACPPQRFAEADAEGSAEHEHANGAWPQHRTTHGPPQSRRTVPPKHFPPLRPMTRFARKNNVLGRCATA